MIEYDLVYETFYTISVLIIFFRGFAIGFVVVVVLVMGSWLEAISVSVVFVVMWLVTCLGKMVALVRKCPTEVMHYLPELECILEISVFSLVCD